MRGRPKKNIDEQAIRKALLAAAGECLAQKSYASVSIREIAELANTNSAMISYYFQGKQGLVTALLDSVFDDAGHSADLVPHLQKLPPEKRSSLLVEAFLTLTIEKPWLFRMIVDDLVSQNEDVRSMLSSTVADESNRVFDRFLKMQINDNYFRNDINQKMVKVSLLSLLVFPYLGSSILKDAYGVDIKKIQPQKMVEHVVSTFEASLLKNSANK